MTKILEREASGSTLERPVEIERPPVEIPPWPELPATRQPYVRWLGWMLVVAVIAVAGILVAIQGDGVVLDDGSFEANELARMLALTPEIDGSFEGNELARMLALAPEVSDGSFEANEFARMLELEPQG